MIGIALAATHIALPRQKNQRNGRGGDIYIVKHTVNLYLGGSDTRCDQLVADKGDDRVIQGSLVYAVADLVGGGGACVEDFDGFTCYRVAVVVAEFKGLNTLTNLQIRHLISTQCETAARQMRKHQILARQIVVIRALQRIVDDQIGCASHPYVVHVNVDGIASVLVQHVLEAEYVGLRPIHGNLGLLETVVLIHTVLIFADRENTRAGFTLKEIEHTINRVL